MTENLKFHLQILVDYSNYAPNDVSEILKQFATHITMNANPNGITRKVSIIFYNSQPYVFKNVVLNPKNDQFYSINDIEKFKKPRTGIYNFKKIYKFRWW